MQVKATISRSSVSDL
jgi:hypothetical protein